jgi:hypothetical protein
LPKNGKPSVLRERGRGEVVFQRNFGRAITTGNSFLTFCIKILHYVSRKTYVLFLGPAQANLMTFWPNRGAVYVNEKNSSSSLVSFVDNFLKEIETCAR